LLIGCSHGLPFFCPIVTPTQKGEKQTPQRFKPFAELGVESSAAVSCAVLAVDSNHPASAETPKRARPNKAFNWKGATVFSRYNIIARSRPRKVTFAFGEGGRENTAMIESVCAAKGFKAPIICTPEELLESKP
jgi:hypothetical protein